MSESIQHKLDRVRPPRVQITYDVQIGDAFEVKELPLVVGVMADLSGQLPADKELPRLRDRQFVEIDSSTFREVFTKTAPRSSFKVDNLVKALAEGATDTPKLDISLGAEANPKLDNTKPLDALLTKLLNEDPLYMFNPLWIVRHTTELNALYEARTRLADLLGKLDGNEKLGQELKTALGDPDLPKSLALDKDSYPPSASTKLLM